MNRTKIRWTPALAEQQMRANEERRKRARQQRRAEQARRWIGPLNLVSRAEDRPAHSYRHGIPRHVPGWIYVITVGHLCKIGQTLRFDRRIKELKETYGFRSYQLVILIEVADMTAIETELHRMYAHKRVRGEWFALDPDDILTLSRLARQIAI